MSGLSRDGGVKSGGDHRVAGLRHARKVGGAIVLLVAAVTLLALIEGVSSLVVVGYDLATRQRILAEHLSTRYDPNLGWVGISNLFVKDMYGPSIYLRTNSMGFRNSEEFDRGEPEGKLRVICSGDSFTLGFGVDNDHAWCQQLVALDSRLQTVNMGQGGYGADQAFLWYQRDGRKLDHSIHLFAVIASDLTRMRSKRFLGYEKPVLTIRNGELIAENVPVPKRWSIWPWLERNKSLIKRLRFADLMGRVIDTVGSRANTLRARRPNAGAGGDDPASQRPVIGKLLDALVTSNQAKDSSLVVVYLPLEVEYDGYPPAEPWRQLLHEETAARLIPFIDLTGDFQQLPRRDLRRMFIRATVRNFLYGSGHYSNEGNRFVAERILARVTALPDVTRKLGALRGNKN